MPGASLSGAGLPARLARARSPDEEGGSFCSTLSSFLLFVVSLDFTIDLFLIDLCILRFGPMLTVTVLPIPLRNYADRPMAVRPATPALNPHAEVLNRPTFKLVQPRSSAEEQCIRYLISPCW